MSGYYVLAGISAGALALVFISTALERKSRNRNSFSLSKEIEKFRKERARRRKEELKGKELARSYILAAISLTDLETVEDIVREIRKEREEEEERMRELWEADRKRSEATDDVGWYTTVNPYSV
ncbi:MAG: hypothetical protein Q9N34_09205 [Aquificota bacterium]|nr:hypothetical protein [Aquificota bacterium]